MIKGFDRKTPEVNRENNLDRTPLITQNPFLLVLRNCIMNNSNSWYIAMHLDRLNEELLEEYGKNIKDEPRKKKMQTKHNTEIIKLVDNHGF